MEEEYLNSLGILSKDECKRIWDNHRGSINQAAYVLGAFRREFSDAHGTQKASPELVQKAIDCAVFIIRSISGIKFE